MRVRRGREEEGEGECREEVGGGAKETRQPGGVEGKLEEGEGDPQPERHMKSASTPCEQKQRCKAPASSFTSFCMSAQWAWKTGRAAKTLCLAPYRHGFAVL